MRIRTGIIALATVIQSILFLTHFFIYRTWTFAPAGSEVPSSSWLKVTVAVLSVSFMAAKLLAFRYSNPSFLTLFRFAALCLGFFCFLFLRRARRGWFLASRSLPGWM